MKNAQIITEEQKQDIINSLSITTTDSMFTLHYAPNAIEAIIDYVVDDGANFREAIPNIIGNIWKVSPYDQTRFLWALYLLNAPETEQLALAYIDSVDNYSNNIFTKSHLKILAAHTLFYLGNYSKYHIVFDELSKEEPKISSYLTNMLKKIIQNIPSEENRAKSALMKIAAENSESFNRYYATSDLAELYDEEMISFFADRFVDEEDIAVVILLYNSLKIYKDERINSSFKTKLPFLDDGLTRYQILGQILFKYGEFRDYLYVVNYRNMEIDPAVKKYVNECLVDYVPPKPDYVVACLTIINELIDITDMVYTSSWLRDLSYYNGLNNKLQTAREYIASSDSFSCAKEIKSFRESIEQVHADSAGSYPKYVSDDAFKFLYYYPQYILERLTQSPKTQNRK